MKDKTKFLIAIGIVYLLWPKKKNGINGISDKVDDIFQIAIQKFKEAGYIVRILDNSTTPYGHSRYFKVFPDGQEDYAKKVRVSDHSLQNIIRMQTEIAIYKEADIQRAIDEARFYFFAKVKETPEDVEMEVIKKYLLPDDKILSERTAKKTGQPVYKVLRRVIKKEYYLP